MARSRSAREQSLLDLLGASGDLGENARKHGVLSEVFGVLSNERPDLERERIARSVDHEAHLAALFAIDRAFSAARLRGAVLKGVLLARRLYRHPELRPTSDIDLLVAEADLDRAIEVLGGLGYAWTDTPAERWSRREHHHLHLAHPAGLPLELHFAAYRGFGSRLASEPLLEQALVHDGFEALRVLAPADELVYLSAHAAAHRFERLGWTLDIALLVDTMTADDLELATRRATESGFLNVLQFALLHARSLLVAPITIGTGLGAGRRFVATRTVLASGGRARRAASRVLFALSLCENGRTAASFLATTIRHHAG